MNKSASPRDIDFPVGLGCPHDHPMKQQLTRLCEEHAPEYARAPQSSGFYSQECGCFIRSRSDIITTVIHELMPQNGGGRFMIKDKKHGWVIGEDVDYRTPQVRIMVQARFLRQMKDWKKKSLPFPPILVTQSSQEEHTQSDGGADTTNDSETTRAAVKPLSKNTAADSDEIDEPYKQGLDEVDRQGTVQPYRRTKVFPNVFSECDGAATWTELLTIPIPNGLRLSEVARSYAYYGDDRRLLVDAKCESGRNVTVYKCPKCSWEVKFIRRRGAVKENPWYLHSWGTSFSATATATTPRNDASPSKHEDGCHPVADLRRSDVLRNSLLLRDYLSRHRQVWQVTRDQIESLMLTNSIDLSRMAKGSFYNALNNILGIIRMENLDVAVANGDRSSLQIECTDGVDHHQEEEEARVAATTQPDETAANGLLLLKSAAAATSVDEPRLDESSSSIIDTFTAIDIFIAESEIKATTLS